MQNGLVHQHQVEVDLSDEVDDFLVVEVDSLVEDEVDEVEEADNIVIKKSIKIIDF